IGVALLDAAPPRRLAATALALEASAKIASGTTDLALHRLRLVPRGLSLSPVEGEVRRLIAAADGALTVSGLRLATARSHVDGDVTLARGRRVDGRLALGPLAAADVRAIVPASPLGADVRARARVRGPWQAIAGVLRVELTPGGRLDAR